MGIYNCADTLSQAIESILAQTYKNWELIMCDDGSTDDTVQVAENYRKSFPEKVFLIKNKKNSGLAVTLNHCLKYAIGDYIARMDGDDISVPERFEKQVDFLENNPEYDLVSTLMIPFDNNIEGIPRGIDKQPDMYSLLTNVPFAHATIMAKREVYQQLGGYSILKRTIRGQDLDLWFRFYKAGFNGYVLQEGLYKVREDMNSFKRKKLIYRIHEMQTRLYGYRLLNFPLRYYPLALRPVIVGLIPRQIMFSYRSKILKG
ncbi:glycosyltransferase EpsE [Bacillus niacini]|uniref:Glycosyltransferase EpsE n=1 Tax=Neobacillus niacini TaxID=86668 RepID=A0A852T7T1_9BACI|nr:glycosyltransferase EpsE [Neobacillus niacini]